MAAVKNYVPSKDADLANWLSNFTTLIAASPAAYGLTASDSAAIAAAVLNFSTAYTAVTSPDTKTASAVSTKNSARIETLALIRPYAQQIALNAGVPSASKIALGLNPRTSTPQPVAAPNSAPVLLVQSASAGALILRYRDSQAGVAGKGKPYGVLQCRLFGAVSATPITDASLLPLLATPTKTPFVLDTSNFTAGGKLYLAAQWATRKGLTSAMSAIISTVVV